ncbi:FecR family protein [Chitinophaga tropicalis]|uniref:DUF4974 domain-containing protein n=1 Tax=Chitinophaga tropicalis TaxID=2683588 RepID=A0A7K1UC20_9BACT|nr:FecR family protein [Chitinophaga tropicalis]MVT11932.1 DUF4974 domain-containing protein [Chitinophaga tropicalis]
MDQKEFNILLDKYAKGLLNKQEAERLELWLDSLEDKSAFSTIPEEELNASKTAMFERLTARINNVPQKKTPVYRMWPFRIAAAVAILVIAGFICRESVLNIVAPHRTTYAVSVKGRVTKQILSDGTIVWLKGNSRLAFPAKFGNGKREVTLEGEALFEVAKDEKHPFRIYCGTLTTTVLGTSFNICDTGEEIAVSVLTGKVSVTSDKTRQRIINADESIVYSETDATVKQAHPTQTAVHEFTKGTEYDMAFNDAGMAEVIQRIEKKFEVNINLEDTAILKSLITADMTDQSLENTMGMIGQALSLDVEIKGRTVVLQPKK